MTPPLTTAPLSRKRVPPEELSLPGDIEILFDVESPNNNNNNTSISNDHEHDDLLASYMDMEKIEGAEINDRNYSMIDDFDRCNDDHMKDDDIVNMRNKRNNKIKNGDDDNKHNKDLAGDVKKAMSPDKLAELWNVDPKRAKRILANRQSAARSKERKARYIVELEKKVQALQTEATSLSVQLSLYERDTSGFTNENTELRRQLESMEQQAQLRDALNDALKQELDRLKVATGECSSPTNAFIVPMQNNFYNLQPPQPGLDSPKSKLLPLYPVETNMSSPRHSNRSKVSDLQPLELNMSFNPQALESPRIKMSNLCLSESNLPSPHQPEDHLSRVKSQQQLCTCEANMLSLPQSPKVQQLYPPDTSLYIPADSPKTRMPHSYSYERNMHCLPQPVDSPRGHLPQYSLQPNTSNSQQHVTSQSHMFAPTMSQDHPSKHVTSQSHMLAQTTSQDHPSKLQGFDIGGRGSLLMVEAPSIFASETMGRY